jgi:uncharacterized membrane protein (UPF0127 family)
MSVKSFIIIVLIALGGLGLTYAMVHTPSNADEIKQAGPPAAHDGLPMEMLVIKTAGGKEHTFEVEIARRPDEQAYGLMNRKSMDKDHGMLFIFTAEDERSFWMKNTLIPLDMIFIRADGTIHRVHDSAIPNDLTPVNSRGPVLAVLELNGGRAADLKIKAGDMVLYKTFQPKP